MSATTRRGTDIQIWNRLEHAAHRAPRAASAGPDRRKALRGVEGSVAVLNLETSYWTVKHRTQSEPAHFAPKPGSNGVNVSTKAFMAEASIYPKCPSRAMYRRGASWKRSNQMQSSSIFFVCRAEPLPHPRISGMSSSPFSRSVFRSMAATISPQPNTGAGK